MQAKKFTLINRGMNRDLSISKTGQSVAFENHNIRITARDNDTLLSVTNERGTKQLSFVSGSDAISGKVIGWNKLDNHLILFTHETASPYTDRIYRIDYNRGEVQPYGGFVCHKLFEGSLSFSADYAIESVVDYESESVQKIYWVDGINVMRFMNFMAETRTVVIGGTEEQVYPWQTDAGVYITDYFDSCRAVNYDVECAVYKDGTGNTRPNGTIQYVMTYYNKYGQETGYVWCSDIIYLSPFDHGGSADETNTNAVKLTFSSVDSRYENFRVYSIFRSSVDGDVVANILSDIKIVAGTSSYTVIDDGAHVTAIDTMSLLYLGSKPVHPGTIESKEGTLFFGGLANAVHDISTIKSYITPDHSGSYAGIPKSTYISLSFVYSNPGGGGNGINHIPYVNAVGLYPYKNQLLYSSSEITTFKYQEKYRFALKFFFADGSESDAVWIGDCTNSNKPPVIDGENIKRAVACCQLKSDLVTDLVAAGVKSVQLLVAEATYSDRSVLAQGIVNPTVFNAWERYNDRLYSIPSWITRPRRAGIACMHFSMLKSNSSPFSEVQCSYPLDDTFVNPYYGSSTVTIYPQGGGTSPLAGKVMLITGINYDALMGGYTLDFWLVEGKPLNGVSESADNGLYKCTFVKDGHSMFDWLNSAGLDDSTVERFKRNERSYITYSIVTEGYSITMTRRDYSVDKYVYKKKADTAGLYDQLVLMMDDLKIPTTYRPTEQTFRTGSGNWCSQVETKISVWGTAVLYFNTLVTGGQDYPTEAASGGTATGPNAEPTGIKTDGSNWHTITAGGTTGTNITITSSDKDKHAEYRKNLMYVDENILTLNSPEIEYGLTHPDNTDYKFRLIGVSIVSSTINDYDVNASMGYLSGKNLIERDFSTNNIFVDDLPWTTAWPMWEEKSLLENTSELDIPKRESYDYTWGYDSVAYWMYLWNKSGVISGYRPNIETETDTSSGVSVAVDDNSDRYSFLRHKTFAYLTFCHETKYSGSYKVFATGSLRIFDQTSSQYTEIKLGSSTKKYYDGVVNMLLAMPAGYKYPIWYSSVSEAHNLFPAHGHVPARSAYLYSNEPVSIKYATRPHAIITLDVTDSDGYSTYTVLPRFNGDSSEDTGNTGRDVCWGSSAYRVSQSQWGFTTGSPSDASPVTGKSYLFLGEIYKDFSTNTDTRYGGYSESAVANCRFIPASGKVTVPSSGSVNVYGTEGDTYFQRYDCLRTLPYSDDADNSVIDIASVMLETHINLDGRTDKNRGGKHMATMDTAQFGVINPVYSQKDNFFATRTINRDYRNDNFESYVTWTSEKHALADIDEWTHITLVNTIHLNQEYGRCRALVNYKNTVMAFQDTAISEIIFNPRVQISGSDGVPIELSNSGKVDGNRYLTTNYGCVNKFSIVPGKNALYFVDGFNKAFASLSVSQSGRLTVENISEKLGFGAWFRKHNSVKQWPTESNAFAGFYDTIHSDVYLVRGDDTNNYGSIVYSENLGTFSSFYDYHDIPMMTNMDDMLLSLKGGYLYRHGAGFYCNFHGTQYNFSMEYRVAPEPQADKIWSNIDYRADFYRLLDANGDYVTSLVDDNLIDGGEIYIPAHTENNNTVAATQIPGVYQANETFTSMKVWNEYQHATTVSSENNPIKRFRIWRYKIPRAEANQDSNIYGLDRIRNPWVHILFSKEIPTSGDNAVQKRDMMQLHDIDITYYE